MLGAALVVNVDSWAMTFEQPIVLGAGFCSAAMIGTETTRGLRDGMSLKSRMTTKAAPSIRTPKGSAILYLNCGAQIMGHVVAFFLKDHKPTAKVKRRDAAKSDMLGDQRAVNYTPFEVFSPRLKYSLPGRNILSLV